MSHEFDNGEAGARHRKRQQNLDLYYRQVAAGVCVHCGSAAQTGKTQCISCALKKAQRVNERYHRLRSERRALGLCIHCGKAAPSEGLLSCQPCRDQRRRPKDR